jgi:flagellar basal-body rod modification protein FlgD
MPVSSLIALEEQKAAAQPDPEEDAGALSALASKLNPLNLLS